MGFIIPGSDALVCAGRLIVRRREQRLELFPIPARQKSIDYAIRRCPNMKRFLAVLLLLAFVSLPALAEAELVYRTDDVELHLPAFWAGKVLILPSLNGATFYQKASYDKYMEEKGIPGGGYLFTLGGCVNSDFKDLPSFIYLGFCEESVMNYYLELPTDYPAYMDDEIRAEWDDMHNMTRGIAQGAVIRGSAVKPGSKRYTGIDPWGNPLAITIDSIADEKISWTYTEDFAGQMLVQSFADTDIIDGQVAFHVEGTIQDADYITCDYSGTMTVGDDALTITFTSGEMTEASPEGGSTAYHVEALEEADRTVVLKSAVAEAVDAAPPEIITSGDYDYSVHDGTATIVNYTGEEQTVEIPSEIDGHPVTEVGAEAFRYQKLKAVSFPDSIRSIGIQAFEYSEITDALQLPENVTISKNAFSYAKLPSAVVIPAGATVEKCAFSYCEKMERAVVEPGVLIRSRAFEYCGDLELVVCAGGSHLEKKAFGYCRNMKQAILCGDVEAEEGAFSNCGDLKGTNAEAGEYDALKQSTLDGSLGQSMDPSPDEAEEIVLEIINSPATLDGVTVTLNKATAVKNQKPEGFTYTFSGTLENNSDEGIMRVIYTFSLIDVNGEEFRSFGEVYDGEDAALPPHAKIDFNLDGIKWGKQSVPAAVEIGVSSVQTEAELPPAKLPQKGEYLYRALGDEKLANIREEKPVELSFHVDQGGYGRTAVFKAGDALDEAIELFCAIQIGEESGEWVTDNYNWIALTWEDGSHTSVSLNLNKLEYYVHSTAHTFELENLDGFWSHCAGYLKEDN